MKGVILAAGYGTRFLPATKTLPKELFPLVDTPAIALVVAEMQAAGIEDVLIITSRRKKPLEDYFDREVELETAFTRENASGKQKKIQPAPLNVFFLRQQVMAGTGDALLLTEPFVGDSPFVAAYPDDIQLSGPSLSGQLIARYRQSGCTVLAASTLAEGDLSRYGVIAYEESQQEGNMVQRVVEKPPPGEEPSRVISYGRYLYHPEIFAALRASRGIHRGPGEFTQSEAINALAARQRVVMQRIEGQMLDVGTPEGYLRATVEMGLHRQEFREPFMRYLRQVLARHAEGY